jgi:hypothetical protein
MDIGAVVREMEMHTAEPLALEFSNFEVEIAVEI